MMQIIWNEERVGVEEVEEIYVDYCSKKPGCKQYVDKRCVKRSLQLGLHASLMTVSLASLTSILILFLFVCVHLCIHLLFVCAHLYVCLYLCAYRCSEARSHPWVSFLRCRPPCVLRQHLS